MILSYLKVNLYFKPVSNNAILQKNLEDSYDFKLSGINKVLKIHFSQLFTIHGIHKVDLLSGNYSVILQKS